MVFLVKNFDCSNDLVNFLYDLRRVSESPIIYNLTFGDYDLLNVHNNYEGFYEIETFEYKDLDDFSSDFLSYFIDCQDDKFPDYHLYLDSLYGFIKITVQMVIFT